METSELNRTELMKLATAEFKNIKDKSGFIKKFNTYSGQKQASLPRIAVKLFLDKKIPFNNAINIINENYINFQTNKIEEIKTKNENYAKKVELIKTKKANEIKRTIIQDRLDEKAFRASKKIDMDADEAIKKLEQIRKQKKDFLDKENSKLNRQKINLDKKKKEGIIEKEFYNKKNKKYTAKALKLEQLLKKYSNSEYNRLEKEKLRINLERKKLKSEVKRHLRTKEQKDLYKLKYGVFTKNEIYNNDDDNYDEITTEEDKLIDSIKHFSIWRINMNIPASNLQVFFKFITDKLDYYDGANVVLYIKNMEGSGVRHITINATYLFDFNDFEGRINEILSGDVAGSDVLNNTGKYELLMDTFDVQIMKFAGFADAEYNIIYKSTKNTDNLILDCGYKALCCCLGDGNEKIGDLIMKDKYDKDYNDVDDFNTVTELSKFIIKNKLKISIVANGIIFKNGVRNLLKNAFMKSVGKIGVNGASPVNNSRIETEINNKKILLTKINDNDIVEPKQINEYDKDMDQNQKQQYIIYDAKNSHFEYALNSKIEINDNIYIGSDYCLYKYEENKILELTGKFRRFMNVDLNNNNIGMIKKIETYYVGFDFETVIDYSSKSRMRPYSVSYGLFSEEDMKKLEEADKNTDEKQVDYLRNKNMVTSIGFNCIDKFIDWIIKIQINKKLVFIGFNNSNFDNYILIDRILEIENDDIKVSSILYNGSQLLNAVINGRHTFFDLSRHLLGTLKNCCEGFKVKTCAKLNISHHYYQNQYDNGTLIDYITDNKELKKYNENDVMSVMVIYSRYKEALSNIDGMDSNNLHENLTIGGLTYKRFLTYWKVQNIKLPKLTEEQYFEVLKYKCAGRVEMFNGKQFINEEVCSYDVCSLYPYVMAVLDCYYPSGDIYDTTEFKEDLIGFYWCDIDQSNLKLKNLPNIYPRKTETENQFDYDGMLFNYCISSVMIKLLRKFGCEVVIKKGFYFTEKVKSCKMFKPILEMMKLKVEQDDLKKQDSDLYNPVLRETSKLLMNSGSGKVIEGLHTNKIEFVNNIEKLVNIQAKYGNINIIKPIGNGVMVEYKKDEIELFQEEQRPIYLGVLIYDYAKSYMFENSYSVIGKDKLIYTDTDATKLRVRDNKQWIEYATKTDVPYWKEVLNYDPRYKDHKIFNPDSKVFGSFEDELSGMNKSDNNPIFCCIQKKSWCYSNNGVKFRFKGLNEKNIILKGDETFILKKNAFEKSVGKNGENGASPVDENISLDINKQKEINDFYNSNTNNIKNNAVKFFKNVFDGNDVFVLCQQFKKNVRNNKKYVGINDKDKHNDLLNSVSVNYMVKKVKI